MSYVVFLILAVVCAALAAALIWYERNHSPAMNSERADWAAQREFVYSAADPSLHDEFHRGGMAVPGDPAIVDVAHGAYFGAAAYVFDLQETATIVAVSALCLLAARTGATLPLHLGPLWVAEVVGILAFSASWFVKGLDDMFFRREPWSQRELSDIRMGVARGDALSLVPCGDDGSPAVAEGARSTGAEALANAAVIAADGVAHGLPERRRRQAEEFLVVAEGKGLDAETIGHIRALLESSEGTPDRLMRLRDRAVALIPDFYRSPRWIPVVGRGLVIAAALTVIVGVLSFYFSGDRSEELDIYIELTGSTPATWILLISGIATLALALPAMVARRRGVEPAGPLRGLRIAALVFMLSNALVDFALEGFGALFNLALGLFALSIVSYHLAQASVASDGSRDQLRV